MASADYVYFLVSPILVHSDSHLFCQTWEDCTSSVEETAVAEKEQRVLKEQELRSAALRKDYYKVVLNLVF